MIRTILVVGLLAAAIGCRSTDCDARIFHVWGCEDAQEFKARMDEYKHVFVVRVDEDQWDDRGPNQYSWHHYRGTVVKVYKGDWRVSDGAAFVEGLDYPAPLNPKSATGYVGVVFTNLHGDSEIDLDTGQFVRYDAECAPALDYAFSQKSGQ